MLKKKIKTLFKFIRKERVLFASFGLCFLFCTGVVVYHKVINPVEVDAVEEEKVEVEQRLSLGESLNVGLVPINELNEEVMAENVLIEVNKRVIVTQGYDELAKNAQGLKDSYDMYIEEQKRIEEEQKSKVITETFRITAYCPCQICCGKYALNRPYDEFGQPIVYGASGNRLIPNYSVAVDPSKIPYGTKLYINGREYVAHDCGGSIKGNDIDMYFSSHEDALNWGARYIEVTYTLD